MSQLNASAMNPEIRAAIEGFAKSRNVSPAACLQAAAIALAMQPFEEGDTSDIISKPAQQRATKTAPAQKRIPRQAGEKSLEFREAVIAKAPELKGKRHTFAEVGAIFGIDQANASNNLKWLQKQKKIDFRVVGHATKQAGQKGRAPAIIEFV
ncbi:hypothetical protein D3C87_325040 [compost metagenome]